MNAAPFPVNTRPKSARVVFVDELNDALLTEWSKQGVPLRVTGRLVDYNVQQSEALIEDNKVQLVIDTSILSVFEHRINGVYQFMGQLVPTTTATTHYDSSNLLMSHRLQATLVREVNELDIQLYRGAVDLIRKRHSWSLTA
ncbi:telomere-capping, CST complex subunit-domain-containing protein [Syncephalis fuscata]|nr:telomere-capping, CST complex subunit-domain-containing protein [Syncephalis fuscata]